MNTFMEDWIVEDRLSETTWHLRTGNTDDVEKILLEMDVEQLAATTITQDYVVEYTARELLLVFGDDEVVAELDKYLKEIEDIFAALPVIQ